MPEKNRNEPYEDGLREILSSGPDLTARSRLHPPAVSDQPVLPKLAVNSESRTASKILEMVVRIAAGAAVVALLLLFGSQIAGR